MAYHLYNKIENGVVVNTGYYCCDGTKKCGCEISKDWSVSQTQPIIDINGGNYVVFVKTKKGTNSIELIPFKLLIFKLLNQNY